MARISMYDDTFQFTADVSQPPAAASTTPASQLDYSSVAVVTALVILSAIFFLAFFSIFARRIFTDEHDDPNSRNFHGAPTSSLVGRFASVPRGLDPTAIKTLPLLPYDTRKRTGCGGGQGCDCVVCLSEFCDGEVVKAIPCCGHLFHPQCIDSWLVAHASCPLCRSTELFRSMEGSGDRGDFGPNTRTPHDVVDDGDRLVVVDVGSTHDHDDERDVEVEWRGGGSGMGRSRSWCCLTVGGGERGKSSVDGGDELSRMSCSF